MIIHIEITIIIKYYYASTDTINYNIILCIIAVLYRYSPFVMYDDLIRANIKETNFRHPHLWLLYKI